MIKYITETSVSELLCGIQNLTDLENNIEKQSKKVFIKK